MSQITHAPHSDTPSQKELLETLERIHGLPVLVMGDLILDRYIWGKVDRISPEAPVPVVHVRKVEDRLGGAANAVRNLRSIGAEVSVCGLVGNDEEGQIVLRLLDAEGVDRSGVIIDRDRPTCVKTRVIAHSQQVVRIDREETGTSSDSVQENLAGLVVGHLAQAKVAIVSDYGKGTLSAPVLKRLTLAQQAGEIGLGVKPLFVDPHPANFQLYSGITIAKPNRREAELASGVVIDSKKAAVSAANILLKKWRAEMMVITLGEDGLVIVGPGHSEGLFLETVAQEVYDVSGAGDTVTAVFSAALGVSANATIAGFLANLAAGIVVSEVGTVSVGLDRLREHIQTIFRD